jgi:hypothetical protein
MINCSLFSFNFAFNSNLRRYKLVLPAPVPAALRSDPAAARAYLAAIFEPLWSGPVDTTPHLLGWMRLI